MNKQTHLGIKTLGITFGFCIAGILASNISSAQYGRMHEHHEHEAYFRALEDLRAARWLMDHRPGNWMQAQDERDAQIEIEKAIKDLKDAAIDDGRPINDHPQLEERPDHGGRLHEAQDFLGRAKAELAREADREWGHGMLDRTMRHIDFAQNAVGRAIAMADREMRPVPPPPPPAPRPIERPAPPMQHPAYMHAIADLRAAHWMLEHRPGNWEQSIDERNAEREIEAALREIKEAAIDDGRGIDDHGPVDERADRGGRLHKAEDYLRQAREDIAHGEDDAFANRLRERSFRHIDAALENVHRAMHSLHF